MIITNVAQSPAQAPQQQSASIGGAANPSGEIALSEWCDIQHVEGAQSAAQGHLVADFTALYVPQRGGLATNRDVLGMLHAHAQAAGTLLQPEEIKKYVALGQRVVDAIRLTAQASSSAQETRSGNAQSTVAGVQRLKVATQAGDVMVTPNQEVTRAISWYVAACAALQDVNQPPTSEPRVVDGKVVADLSISGSYVFKDPGNAIYNFMQSSPLAYARVSTHFNERSASDLLFGGYADQRGIEDYQRRLPGENGTILFDKLKNGEMFVKFEAAGVPVYPASKRVDDMGQGRAGFLEVSARQIMHSLSYLRTRFVSSPGMERKEHVYKGILKLIVHDPFMQVVTAAAKLALLEPGVSAKYHAQLSKEKGLPHLEDTLNRLRTRIDGQAEQSFALKDLKVMLDDTEKGIQDVKERLGMQSNHLGIVRRGAETHVDLDPLRDRMILRSSPAVTFASDSGFVTVSDVDSDVDSDFVTASDFAADPEDARISASFGVEAAATKTDTETDFEIVPTDSELVRDDAWVEISQGDLRQTG